MKGIRLQEEKNQGDDGAICLGSELKFSLEGRLSGKLARVEDYFWNSTFNDDLDGYFRAACPRWLAEAAAAGEDPLVTWERLGAEPGFDPCALDWIRYRKWGDVLDSLTGGA